MLPSFCIFINKIVLLPLLLSLGEDSERERQQQ
jgi:hypothetical protein